MPVLLHESEQLSAIVQTSLTPSEAARVRAAAAEADRTVSAEIRRAIRRSLAEAERV